MTSGIKTEPVEGVPPEKFSNTDIVAVQIRSGEIYRFSQTRPAAVVEEQIKGEAMERKEIPLNQIKKLIKDPMGNIREVVEKNGTDHELAFGKIGNDTLIAYFDESPFRPVSLLYSQVSLITIRSLKLDIIRTSLLIVAIAASVTFLAVLGFAAVLKAWWARAGVRAYR
jgi:hypothetical protein